MLSYISLGWAYVLFSSPQLFESSQSWNEVEAIASYEWVVASCAFICAITKVIGMALGNARLRRIGLLMSAVFWVIIAAGMLISTGGLNMNTGFIAYSGIAVMSLWTSKEVGVNGRVQ
ncbi:hypothetical protein [Planococcus sp. YIM B11945]|uniref:hypothetical protein n=1 Tax=Planococcus sp. YIM B11945 TaxID=3435410 RepID=UPI003D7E98BE